MALNNDQMLQAAARLVKAARSVNHPLLPASVKDAINLAAILIENLVMREVKRDESNGR